MDAISKDQVVDLRPWPYPSNEIVTRDMARARDCCEDGIARFLKGLQAENESALPPALPSSLIDQVPESLKDEYEVLNGRSDSGFGHVYSHGSGYGYSYGENKYPTCSFADRAYDGLGHGYGYGYTHSDVNINYFDGNCDSNVDINYFGGGDGNGNYDSDDYGSGINHDRQ